MDLSLPYRNRVMSYEEENLKADELGKEDCILEPEVIVTVKEEVKVSAECSNLSYMLCIYKYYEVWVDYSSFIIN
jgi:hypothetical protein